MWRDPLAWKVTLFMGLQSALAYCVFGWLAPILRERGLDGITAGLGWVRAAETVLVMGKPTKADVEGCWNLGATVAATLME